jgi:hypothetical protein
VKNGSLYWIDTTIAPFSNESNQSDYHMSIRFDLMKQALPHEEIVRKNKFKTTVRGSG